MPALRRVVGALICAGALSLAVAEPPPAPPPAPPLPDYLIPPMVPVRFSEFSSAEQQRFAQLEAELKQVEEWQRLEALPEWIHDPQKRVITFRRGGAFQAHGFRYTLVAGPDEEVLVVRAGGLADRPEVFWRKLPKLPEAPAEPAAPAPAQAQPRSPTS